jgi:mRNA interferase RelE/StbE
VSWAYRFSVSAKRELRDLDKQGQREILSYLDSRIATSEDPRRFGKPLRADLAGLWRYRVRDYRLICQIQNEVLVVLVVAVGHRKEIYL